jgi:hypothetical protein
MDHRRSGGDFRCHRDCGRAVVLAVASDRSAEKHDCDHEGQNDEHFGDQHQRVACHRGNPQRPGNSRSVNAPTLTSTMNESATIDTLFHAAGCRTWGLLYPPAMAPVKNRVGYLGEIRPDRPTCGLGCQPGALAPPRQPSCIWRYPSDQPIICRTF